MSTDSAAPERPPRAEGSAAPASLPRAASPARASDARGRVTASARPSALARGVALDRPAHPDAAGAARPERPALTHLDYAALARLSPDELARQCEVDVFRATGPGGQGVNTTDSAVRMRHVPTGVTVVSRESRSQWQNRQTCLAKLREIFDRRSHPPKRRVKTKVSHAQKERRLKAKHLASEKKSRRGRVSGAGEGW